MEPLAQTPFALSELVVDNWLILTVHHLQSEQLARKRVDVHGDFRDFLCVLGSVFGVGISRILVLCVCRPWRRYPS